MFNDLILKLISVPGKHFNDVIIGVIFFLFVFWFIKYDIIILNGLTRSFRKVTLDLSTIEFNILDGIDKVNYMFEERAHLSLKKLWKSYYDDFRSIEEDERSPDLEEYFNITSMITIPAGRKKTELIPAMLTGIGILGTSLEIAAGLQNTFTLSASTAAYSDQQFFNIIISSSFVSIFAIALALIFQYIDRQLYHGAMVEVDSFTNTLQCKIPVSKTEEYLHILLKEQQTQAACFHNALENLSANISRNLANALVPAISNVFAPQTESMKKTLLQLEKAAIENQTEVIQKIIDNFVINMSAALSGQFESLGESIRSSGKNLEVLISELAESNDDQRKINSDSVLIAGAIAQYHTDIVRSSENLSESLEKLNHFSGTISETADISRELLQNIADRQLQIQQENSNYITCMIDNMESSLNRTVEGFIKKIEVMIEQMDIQVRSAGVYTKEINDGIGELNWRLGDAVREFNEQVHSGLERTFNDFDAGLGEICMRLSGTITQIKDSIDDLPVVFSGLKDSVGAPEENDI